MISDSKAPRAGVDVYVSRRIDMPPAGSAICPGLGTASYCFSIHGVSWRETRVRGGEQVMVYRFRAPDAESVRQVLRRAGIDFDDLWIHPGGSPAAPRLEFRDT